MSDLGELLSGNGNGKKSSSGSTGEWKEKTANEMLYEALTGGGSKKSASFGNSGNSGIGKLEADRAKGIEFSEDGKTLLKYPDDLQDETYEIPDRVECIAKNAFNSAMSLHHVAFPKSLKRIEKEAFISAGLREAVLPEGLEEIGAAAFWCSELTEVSIPRSVKEIGEYAFYGCSSLKKIVMSWDEPHGNVMALRYNRGNSESWQDGEAPASLFFSPRVFSGCKNLLDVTGCDAVKALVSEYQRRAANPLPEDAPECPPDYQFDDEW